MNLNPRAAIAPRSTLALTLARLGFGVAGGFAAAVVAFREQVFDPRSLAFECAPIAAMFAGALSLVRSNRPGAALGLAVVYGAVRAATGVPEGPAAATARLFVGLGIVLVAMVYDALARDGFRFGKFLIVGPLLGGVYIATSPLTVFQGLSLWGSLRPLLFQIYLGIVVGDGVALGVELAEVLPAVGPSDVAEPPLEKTEPRELPQDRVARG